MKDNFDLNFTQEELRSIELLNSLSNIDGRFMECLKIDNV